jgi:hypothetical protein
VFVAAVLEVFVKVKTAVGFELHILKYGTPLIVVAPDPPIAVLGN